MFTQIVLSALFSLVPNPKAPSLASAHQPVVDTWLGAHPGYRIASESDCGDCEEQIQAVRRGMGGVWKPVPGYQPYYLVGDFNSDGNDDFAIVVVAPNHTSKHFILLVFNGPFTDPKSKKAAFVSKPMDLSGQGLFFGPPRPKPYRLLVAPFESEGTLLLPRGKSYVWSQAKHED